MTEMKSPNVHARENRNDTPRKRKTHIYYADACYGRQKYICA